MTTRVMALYHFVDPLMAEDRVQQLRDVLLGYCNDAGISGTLLLAREGINGTVSAPQGSLDALAELMRAQPEFLGLEVKCSDARQGKRAFTRMKVKVKDEIVSFGQPVTPARRTGEHVDASRWNELLDDPDVVVIDTRNHYEVEIGTFPGALDPGTSNFREFPEFVDQRLDPNSQPKVAMFCTGGIRCEKASAYLLERGFDQVYQLEGGVLKYLEEVAAEQGAEPNKWQGECFVFDQRVALNARLEPGDYLQCHACRRPVDPDAAQSPDYVKGVSCPRCINEGDVERRAGFVERQRQIELAARRGETHIGPDAQNQT